MISQAIKKKKALAHRKTTVVASSAVLKNAPKTPMFLRP